MKYIFVGNRANVLKKMIDLKCEIVQVFSVENSYLEKELEDLNIPSKTIKSKKELVEDIINTEFDCLVSNGCPYILPISKIKKKDQLFINIHPSLLPDLKGKHPINGALLYGRRHGVTCHHMDDGIDTGKIIAKMEIPIGPQMDLGLLYQISFFAEGEVFYKALKDDFKADENVFLNDNPIYYTRDEEDLIITEKDSLNAILNKIKAFGIPSLCARFYRNQLEYRILSANMIKDEVINKLFDKNELDEILFIYDDNVVVKYSKFLVKFHVDNIEKLKVGEKFFVFEIKGA